MDAKEIAARLGANGDPKLDAAADFAARLLNSPIGSTVAKGEAPAEWVRLLNKGLETRNLALYNVTVTLNPDHVQPILVLAQDMLVFLEKKLFP